MSGRGNDAATCPMNSGLEEQHIHEYLRVTVTVVTVQLPQRTWWGKRNDYVRHGFVNSNDTRLTVVTET